MLEWFTENAFFPSVLGILLAISFIGLAISSGENLMLKIGVGIAVLTALLITTEILIVTERESVENSLYDMADHMRANEFERVYDYLDKEELVLRAKRHLGDAICHSCNVTAINWIEVDENGKTATAEFVAFAKASNRAFPSPTPIQRRIKLHFQKRSDNWKIVDFETSDPRSGLNL